MALKYLVHIETLNINMQKNELQNAVIHNLTTVTRPASPITGQIIYNTTINTLEIWNGTAWISTGGDITDVIAGVGLSGGGTFGSVTLNLDFSELADMTEDISGTTEFILQNGTIESRKAANEIKLSNFINDQNFSSTVGTVTSIVVAANDGISISGSPITSSGTITLGLTNGSIANAKLANSSVTIGSTLIPLGATFTSLSGLTSLDFAVGNRTIGASIGTNNLTLGAATSTVIVPGNLTVSGSSVGIGTTTPSEKLHVSGSARITGAIYDSTNSAGTSGQVLSTTATGTQWIALESDGISGSGTVGRLSKFTSANVLGDSIVSETEDTLNVLGNIIAPTFTGALQGTADNANTLEGENGSYYLNYDNFTNTPAQIAEPTIQWIFLASHFSIEPEEVATIDDGTVFKYTLEGVERFRLVPEPYDPSEDAFFEAFDGTTLTNLIIKRG